jgi:hypothetical protein
MLDTLSYVKNSDGSFTKTVTGVSSITDIAGELSALNDQLAAFQKGQLTDPSNEVAAAITNYQAQIAILGAD